MKPRVLGLTMVLWVVAGPGIGHAGLQETPHNLSPGGMGRRQAGRMGSGAAPAGNSQDYLCIYCHTPHNAKGRRGLWSRELAPVTYKLYQSSTLQARLQQPTGTSRLCLSCHDGMMALDAPKSGSRGTLGRLTGSSVLGTDLSNDHPISFVYDQALVTRQKDLASPATLKGAVRLDENGELQCTSCHDAHTDQHSKFLVLDPAYSALCTACHRLPRWQESAHATSAATARSAAPLPGSGYPNVGQNGCSSCHQSHGAQHPQRLLTAKTEEGVCFACHDGQVAAKDLRRDFLKYSAHHVERYIDIHDPIENPNSMPRHVECVDCHNAHAARARAAGGQISGTLIGAAGVSINGGAVREATFEYEVCLKCHGIGQDSNPVVFRTDSVTNVRLEIDPNNPSFHPVADVGRNFNIRGLVSPLTAASRTPCTSCHNSDAASPVGGNAPRGPHGSNYRPILAAEYHFDATTSSESYQLYALCYGCHDRNALLNRPDGFPHQLHVGKVGASCAVCHAAHGSRRNAHLINFMTRDLTGKVAVTASSSGQLGYDSFGGGTGRCFLTCHGSDHNPTDYPTRLAPAGATVRSPVK